MSEDEHSYIDKKVDDFERQVDSHRQKDRDDNELKLVETVFDEKTRLILYSMINKQRIESITGAISTGKEANVYYATTKENKAIAIKIFRIDAPSFRKMRGYVEGDFRFKRVSSRRSSFIEVWARKEFKNLQRMKTKGIPVPQPYYVERNILLMEFLGDGDAVLPLLKDCVPDKPGKLYKRVMESVKTTYREAKLVHADLSAYNILYNTKTDEFFIIDVSQAVLEDHPQADEFLLRDLNNLNTYFVSIGAKIIELEKLFTWITGKEVDIILLSKFLD
ncbi:MAG: serine protein kinase RIO [Candidatus Heimdallarchaeota archaeon]|nr:serine protein kinase RIO [Candidatus Heimdallarchaeota archaeon]